MASMPGMARPDLPPTHAPRAPLPSHAAPGAMAGLPCPSCRPRRPPVDALAHLSTNTPSIFTPCPSSPPPSLTQLIYNKETGQSRGFGFVTFEDERDCRDALNDAGGRDLDGAAIKVNVARGPANMPFPPRGGRGGRCAAGLGREEHGAGPPLLLTPGQPPPSAGQTCGRRRRPAAPPLTFMIVAALSRGIGRRTRRCMSGALRCTLMLNTQRAARPRAGGRPSVLLDPPCAAPLSPLKCCPSGTLARGLPCLWSCVERIEVDCEAAVTGPTPCCSGTATGRSLATPLLLLVATIKGDWHAGRAAPAPCLHLNPSRASFEGSDPFRQLSFRQTHQPCTRPAWRPASHGAGAADTFPMGAAACPTARPTSSRAWTGAWEEEVTATPPATPPAATPRTTAPAPAAPAGAGGHGWGLCLRAWRRRGPGCGLWAAFCTAAPAF